MISLQSITNELGDTIILFKVFFFIVYLLYFVILICVLLKASTEITSNPVYFDSH